MTKTTKAERAKLRRLHAATKHTEDWQAHRDFDDDWVVGVPIDGWSHYQSVCGDTSKACAALIVAARNALPRLLDALDAAEAEREKLRSVLGVDISLAGGLSWVVESIEKIKAERDALQAKLKVSNEALFQAQNAAIDLTAKLDALVAAVRDLDPWPHADEGPVCHSYFGKPCNCLAEPNRASLNAAIAIAIAAATGKVHP